MGRTETIMNGAALGRPYPGGGRKRRTKILTHSNFCVEELGEVEGFHAQWLQISKIMSKGDHL